VPGGSFGEPQLVAQGDAAPVPEGGGYYGVHVDDVALDAVGNAMVSWIGFGPEPRAPTAAIDGPALEVPLPGLPIGADLPPILPPLLDQPPALPSPPVTVDPARDPALPAGSGPLAPPAVVVRPLRLSARASTVRGAPRTVSLRVRCDQACAVMAGGRVAGVLVQSAPRFLAARRPAWIRLRLPRSARDRLRAALRRRTAVSARLAVAAAGARRATARGFVRVTLRR
jgi:hypothetical protein